MKPEMALIGMALNRRHVFETALGAGVNEACFVDANCAAAWTAMVEADKAGAVPDLATIGIKLRGLTLWLVDATERAPIALNERAYIDEVLEARWARNTHAVAAQIAVKVSTRKPFDDMTSTRALIGELLDAVVAGPSSHSGDPTSLHAAFEKLIPEIEQRIADRRDGGKRRGVPLGIAALDMITGGGMRPGGLYTFAARPGVGKTTFAVNAAVAAAEADVSVGFWSVEMLDKELAQKILSRVAMVRCVRMDIGKLDDDELDRIIGAMRKFANKSIWLDDRFGASLERLVATARRLHRREKLGLMIVDYVQQLRKTGGSRESRQQELSAITSSLKQLAIELQVPMMLLAQLNREATRAGSDADVQHIKDSGSIEQDSDVVVIINHDEAEDKTYLDVRKNRHGPTARLLVERDLAVNLFSDANIKTPPAVSRAFEGGDA